MVDVGSARTVGRDSGASKNTKRHAARARDTCSGLCSESVLARRTSHIFVTLNGIVARTTCTGELYSANYGDRDCYIRSFEHLVPRLSLLSAASKRGRRRKDWVLHSGGDFVHGEDPPSIKSSAMAVQVRLRNALVLSNTAISQRELPSFTTV